MDPINTLLQCLTEKEFNQLLLYFHSDRKATVECPGNCVFCKISAKEETKTVLDHLTNCNDQENCGEDCCTSFHKIIKHWNRCIHDACLFCGPLVTFLRRSTPLYSIDEEILKTFNRIAEDSFKHYYKEVEDWKQSFIYDENLPIPYLLKQKKEWHNFVTVYLRCRIITKLVVSITQCERSKQESLPNNVPNRFIDQKPSDWNIEMAMGQEKEFFALASDWEEYLNLVAQKLFDSKNGTPGWRSGDEVTIFLKLEYEDRINKSHDRPVYQQPQILNAVLTRYYTMEEQNSKDNPLAEQWQLSLTEEQRMTVREEYIKSMLPTNKIIHNNKNHGLIKNIVNMAETIETKLFSTEESIWQYFRQMDFEMYIAETTTNNLKYELIDLL